MEPLVTKYIKTNFGIKDIGVFHADICDFTLIGGWSSDSEQQILRHL